MQKKLFIVLLVVCILAGLALGLWISKIVNENNSSNSRLLGELESIRSAINDSQESIRRASKGIESIETGLGKYGIELKTQIGEVDEILGDYGKKLDERIGRIKKGFDSGGN